MKKYHLASTTSSTRDSSTTTRSSTTSSTGSSSSLSSSSTTSTTHGRNSNGIDIRVSISCLRELFQECLGQAMPAPVERRVTEAMLRGCPYEYISYALQEASYAPRPSWKYAEAIINRCIRERIIPETIAWCTQSIIPEEGYKAPSLKDWS